MPMIHDKPNSGIAYAVFFGEHVKCDLPRNVFSPYLVYLILRKNCIVVLFSAVVATASFANTIPDIIHLSSKKKMGGVAANRIIASVTDLDRLRNRPDQNLPCDSVGHSAFVCFRHRVTSKQSVSVRSVRTGEWPANTRWAGRYLAQKPCPEWNLCSHARHIVPYVKNYVNSLFLSK